MNTRRLTPTVDPLPSVFGGSPLRSVIRAFAKRAMDLVLASLGLLIASPVMFIIAVLLWLESPGHVIFAQQRLGQYGRRFAIYKFRKFPANWGSQGPDVTVANDARLTKIGAVLERLKLDELPQLWNIIKGDMSIVGPRPETLRFADLFVDRYNFILDYRPGLFGPGLDRNEGDLYPLEGDPEEYYRRVLFPQKAEKQLAYYQTATLLGDFVWTVKGVWASIAGSVNWRRVFRLHGTVILADILFVQIGWALANVFRYLGFPQGADWDSFLAGLLIFPMCLVIAAFVGRCYHYPVRHFSPADGSRLMVAYSIALMAGFLLLVGIDRHISLDLVPMAWFITTLLLIFGRIGFYFGAQKPWSKPSSKQRQNSPRILVYGSAEAGIALVDWIKNSPIGITVLGFLDDSPEHRNQRVHGVRVLGSERDIPTILSVYDIGEIWLTFAPGNKQRRRLKKVCSDHGIELVVFPELEPFRRLTYPSD